MAHEIGPRAVINHTALRHNLAQARAAAPESRIWAVVKANAYGHSACEVASAISAEGLAVARLREVLPLRAKGERRPVLIMGGVYSLAALKEAIALDCELVVHTAAQAQMLIKQQTVRPIKIWLKVNTGMNRLGFPPTEVVDWLQALNNCPAVRGRPGLMTHLANADDLADPLTNQQCQRLLAVPGAEKCRLNIGNSAGLLGWAAARTHWVRPGLMLYGISPFLGEHGEQRGLSPVMNLYAPLIAIHQCPAGTAVGYGSSYICPESMPVGVIGIGYGDGYPRHAPTGTPVLLAGQRVPLIGRVSMDMISVDLRGLPELPLGTEALLWGRGLPVEEIATCASTIAYQLVTGLTRRVLHVHLN